MRESNAIAIREFHLLAKSYSIGSMKTTAEIRRDNLLLLITKYGSTANLNEALGKARTDATLSQIKNQSKDSKTGVPKSMGTLSARNIEKLLKLENGWMDHAHTAFGETPDHQADQPTGNQTADVSLVSALAVLCDHLKRMDASTRRKSMLMVSDLEKDPDSHAQVASAIEALMAAANRQAA